MYNRFAYIERYILGNQRMEGEYFEMRTIEDTYLRAIFEGSYLKGGIANKQLSELLKVTPASTTEFTQKLRDRGLVRGRKYAKFL